MSRKVRYLLEIEYRNGVRNRVSAFTSLREARAVANRERDKPNARSVAIIKTEMIESVVSKVGR